jgi:hypothetical protein
VFLFTICLRILFWMHTGASAKPQLIFSGAYAEGTRYFECVPLRSEMQQPILRRVFLSYTLNAFLLTLVRISESSAPFSSLMF